MPESAGVNAPSAQHAYTSALEDLMDERAHRRLIIDRSVSCSGFSGDEQIAIYNLSARGCMAAKRSGQFSPGETVLISVVGGIEVAGEVVWVQAPYAAIRFTAQLPERIVTFLGFRNRDRSLGTGRGSAAADGRGARRAITLPTT